MKIPRQVIDFLSEHSSFVVVQADNPDGDSLASSIALENILGDAQKQVYMYCAIEIPSYLRYIKGWDRVSNQLPSDFDACIIVDTSAISILETSQKNGDLAKLSKKPTLIIDHHATPNTIDFATIILNLKAVSTGEIIYSLAQSTGMPINQQASNAIAISIMSDSLGLISESVTSNSIRVLADLVESGVSLANLDNARREFSKKTAELVHYKGQLLQRIEYCNDGRLAIVEIPWDEIQKYSHAYNPSMLVIDEMRQTEGVAIAIAFKSYPDGKVTAKLRCGYGFDFAGKLAEQFGGGGHAYASGFKITDGRSLSDIKHDIIKKSLSYLDKEKS